MLIMALDDERLLLDALVRCIQEAEPKSRIIAFTKSSEALDTVLKGTDKPDVAFLDIETPGISGLELAKILREKSPRTNLVFVTGFSEYALEAMSLYPSGYVMKPVTMEKIRRELDNLRHPVTEKTELRARAQTFGSFEFFIDGEPVRFKLSRTKELLAYLIDRQGASCNTAELCAALFEDEGGSASSRSHFRTLLSDLTATLRANDLEPLLIKRRNSFSVNTELLDCDVYRFYRGDVSAVNAYAGKYMEQYSWAELRNGFLENRQNS